RRGAEPLRRQRRPPSDESGLAHRSGRLRRRRRCRSGRRPPRSLGFVTPSCDSHGGSGRLSVVPADSGGAGAPTTADRVTVIALVLVSAGSASLSLRPRVPPFRPAAPLTPS